MDLLYIIEILEHLFASYSFGIPFVSSFIEMSPLGWLMPGGTLLAFAGFFAYGEQIPLYIVLMGGWTGGLSAFIFSYFLGKKSGHRLIKIFGQEKNAEKADKLLKQHGPTIMTTSMLSALTRFWVAYLAGAKSYPFLKFVFYSTIASLTWSSLMVVAGFLAGSERERLEELIAHTGVISWLILIALVILVVKSLRKS